MKSAFVLSFVLAALRLWMIRCANDQGQLPVYSPPGSVGQINENNHDEGSCGCEEDEFPPGAGFAFRREGYARMVIEGGKSVRKRQFFENERITFKEVLSPGDGKTFPAVGQAAILRYTEFTSNECLPEIRDEFGGIQLDDLNHSVVDAIEGLDELVLKMSVGEKAMFFASLDLGSVRALQAISTILSQCQLLKIEHQGWLQWWLEATCSEMVDAVARIYEVQLLRLEGVPAAASVPTKTSFLW